ncbi:hypothetical protein V6B33_00170 [Mangrovibacillus sp. Mu-81]|uniref:hypothetical protein n=1 Tax=Mangrovibacillus sp. Mu-81 TaxID=3121478 RepID=UPI002FE497FA
MLNFNYVTDAVSIGLYVLSWVLIGLLVLKIYRRQQVKPRWWKAAVATLAGIVTFTINWELSGELVKIPILPLGVWILYGILKRKEDRWDKYRSFAWLGFASNFVFLAATLISIPLYSLVYPESDAATHIADADNASVVAIHPSGEDGLILDKDRLIDQLPSMDQEKVESDVWYNQMYRKSEGKRNKNERFPYQLIGVSSKWGSGVKPVIYLEDDGKGILITTPDEQSYFRFNQSILQEGMAR